MIVASQKLSSYTLPDDTVSAGIGALRREINELHKGSLNTQRSEVLGKLVVGSIAHTKISTTTYHRLND